MLKKFFLLFTLSINLNSGNFEFITHYSIDSFHEKGLTGKNYDIGILEPNLINHSSIEQERLISYYGGFKFIETDYAHANHVGGILAGKKNILYNFLGGVANEARLHFAATMTFFPKDLQRSGNQYILDALEILAKKTKIINLSFEFTDVVRPKCGRDTLHHPLSELEIERIKKILQDNNCVLIFAASNDPLEKFETKTGSSYPILQLLDAGLEDHLLIVGNLEHIPYEQLEQEKNFLLGYTDLNEIFHKENKYNEIVDFLYLRTLMNKYISDHTSNDYLFNKMTKGDIIEFINYQDFNDKEFKEIYYSNFFEDNEYKIKFKQENPRLFGFIEALYFLLDDHVFSNGVKYKNVRNKYSELREFPSTIKSENSFKRRGMLAGYNEKVQQNFICACGTNILSGGTKNDEFVNMTGSSQAAPIVTGIAVLLHEHLSKTNENILFVDVIRFIKEDAQQIGEKASFGLGILNIKKLFSGI